MNFPFPLRGDQATYPAPPRPAQYGFAQVAWDELYYWGKMIRVVESFTDMKQFEATVKYIKLIPDKSFRTLLLQTLSHRISKMQADLMKDALQCLKEQNVKSQKLINDLTETNKAGWNPIKK